MADDAEFDAFAAEIAQHRAGIVLPSEEISTESVARAVRQIRADFDGYSAGAAQLFDTYFGEAGFRRYWMPLLFTQPEMAVHGAAQA